PALPGLCDAAPLGPQLRRRDLHGAARRLHFRVPAVKSLLLPTGVLLLLVIWFGPLLGAWRGSFTAHMLAHMGVIAIAAPLIAIGLPDRWRPGPSMPAALPVLASV